MPWSPPQTRPEASSGNQKTQKDRTKAKMAAKLIIDDWKRSLPVENTIQIYL